MAINRHCLSTASYSLVKKMKEEINNPSVSTQQASTPPPVDTYVPSFQPGAPTPRYFSKRTALIVLAIIFTVAISYGIFFAISTYTAVTAPHDSRLPIASDKPTPTPNQTLIIDSWNVRLPLTGNLYGLKVGPVANSAYSQTDQDVTILVPELDAKWTCAVDKDGIKATLGSIARTTSTKRAGPYKPLATKKLGEYTYSYEGSLTSNCTKDPKYQELVKEFIKSFDSLEAMNINTNQPLQTITPTPSQEQVACTDEARQCPDGSYVGRSGPKCEFVCPK
jgi:hypothetical protein